MMDLKKMLVAVNQRPVAYYPVYRKITGSLTAGILLSQLLYWWAKMDGEGFHKKDSELIEETGLGEEEFRNAKKVLKNISFIVIKLAGTPARTNYEINAEKLAECMLNPPNKMGLNPRTKMGSNNGTCLGQTTKLHNIVTEITTESINATMLVAHPLPDKHTSHASTKLHGTPASPPPGFDELWEAYGLKRNKPDAVKAWSQIPAKDTPQVLPGTKAYLAYLALPENTWRQKKTLGAYLRARMWEDDWGQPKQTDAPRTPNEEYKAQMLGSYPNLKSLTWLSDEEYELVKSRSKAFLGQSWEFRMSPSQVERAIEQSLREMNENHFKRKNHSSVYNFLRDEVKSKIYAE